MIRKLRVTVDGKSYDVVVELLDDSQNTAPPSTTPLASIVSAPLELAPTGPVTAASTAPTGPAAPGAIPSPLAGRVTAINAEVGQEVNEGDHLLTLEAMKMNTFVIAPRAGRVKALHVAVGDAVEEGRTLLTLE